MNHPNALKFPRILLCFSRLLITLVSKVSIRLMCLYLVQHIMLRQIMAHQLFYAPFYSISTITKFSVSKAEF